MQDYILLIAGLAALVFAGDFLVRGAVGLADKFGIPPLIIGLTVISFGTSAPELFISIDAALQGIGSIAVGNVVGSNIANILLVMGMPALIKATNCDASGINKNILVMIGATMVFMVMMLDGVISRIEGGILFALVILFIYDQFRSAMQHRSGEIDPEMAEELDKAVHRPWRIALFLAVGLIGLPIGAELTVNAATGIAKSWNVSDAVIGLTVVAIGTSLPELAATLMAVVRNTSSIAVGNVVGSNLFNLTAVMGPTALISPLTFSDHIIKFDMWVMLLASLLLALLARFNVVLGFGIGLAMTSAYAIYVILTFIT